MKLDWSKETKKDTSQSFNVGDPDLDLKLGKPHKF